jgi:hypothetical protein
MVGAQQVGKMQGYQEQAKSFAAVSILMFVKFY